MPSEPVELETASAGDGMEPATEADAEPKRKRSRRGSRGGRRRRKPSGNGTQDEAAEEAAQETAEAPEPVAPGAAAEYVPMSDWIEDFESQASA